MIINKEFLKELVWVEARLAYDKEKTNNSLCGTCTRRQLDLFVVVVHLPTFNSDRADAPPMHAADQFYVSLVII